MQTRMHKIFSFSFLRNVLMLMLFFQYTTTYGIDVSQLKLDNIDIKNGLSQNSIYSIFQDSKGFMWFCTQEGLNRYDGYSFIAIKKEVGNNNSLVSNYTQCIAESKPGLFWIGTGKGLSIYFFDSKKFINAAYPLQINKIIIEDSLTAWLQTENSLYKVRLVEKPNSKNLEYSIKVDPLPEYKEVLLKNGSSSFLVSGRDNRLYIYNIDTKVFKLKSVSLVWQNLIPKKINTIVKDGDQNYWIGTEKGIYKSDKNFISIDSFPVERAKYIALKDKITGIKIDNDGNVFIASYQNGLLIYSHEKKRFIEYQYDPYDLNGLPDNKISSIYFDKSGTFWIGTKGSGLAVFSPYKYKFKHITQEPFKTTWLTNKYILSFESCDSETVWIGTDGGGLYQFNTKENIFSNWRNNNSSSSLSNDVVQDLLMDEKCNLWVGTLNGICKYIPERNSFYRYYFTSNNSNENLKIPRYFHIRLFESKSGIVYALNEKSIYQFNKNKNQFELAPFQFTETANTTRQILEDNDQTWWIASSGGLFHVNINSGFVDEKAIQKINNDYFKTEQLYSLLDYDNDRFWITTGNNGIYLFNKKTKKIEQNFTEKNGFSNNFVYAILKDDAGKFWMSTNRGITTFEPSIIKIRTYDINDGLQSNEFNTGAFFKTKNNILLFGGINGFNIIDPTSIPYNNYKPTVNITSIKVDETKFDYQNYGSYDKRIKFPNNKNNIEFQFASSDYANTPKNNFEYKLDGYDKNWIRTNRNFASYPKLPHGNYIFYVRASNNDGVFSSEPATFSFRIKPLFWQTWLFRIFAGLFIGFYLYYFITNRIKTERRKHREKMRLENQRSIYEKQLAEIKLKALVAQMNPHFIFNCMNSIQAMILSDQNMQASTYLTKLSRLVRSVLENSVKTFIPLHDVIENLKLYLELESLRFDQQFNYDFRTEGVDVYAIEMPSMLIQPYVENAIWHGLLKKVGEKNIHIHFYKNYNYLICEITDDGIGRVKAGELNLKKQHKSLGTIITQEMFDTLHKIKDTDYSVDIIDLYDEQNLPIGTKVIVRMELN
ncbi:MAG: two-component regulator propeller domain-containing protein [Chitinophagales bacterium]